MDSSNLQPPERRSLSNQELEARVNQAMAAQSGVEAVMELLVAQEALRAQEERDENLWAQNMRANGTPEALAALQAFLGSSSAHPAETVSDSPVASSELSSTEPAEPESSSIEQAPQTVSPEVDVVPELKKPVPVFSWLNPAPPTPIVEVVDPVVPLGQEVQEDVQVVEEPSEPAKPFSWFTKEEPEENVTSLDNQPALVAEFETVQDEVIVEDCSNEVTASDAVVVEETLGAISEPVPVGSESETEFERLLAAAAAEEELTALEEAESRSSFTAIVPPANVIVPSDENRDRGPLSQLWVWLGISATLVPIALAFVLVGLGLDVLAISLVLILGFLCSSLLISVAAIAGKRSGLSTAIISRSVFGVWGNSIPLAVSFIARIVISGLFLAVYGYLMNGLEAKLPEFGTVLYSVVGIDLTTGLLVQTVILVIISLAVLIRGNVSRIIQVLLSLLAFVLVVESFASFYEAGFSFATAGNLGFLSLQALSGFGLVVMVNLTLWFALAPNISKAIPMRVRGSKVFAAVMAANFIVPVIVGVLSIFWLGSFSITSEDPGAFINAVKALPSWAQGTFTSGVSIAIIFAAMLTLRSATLDAISLFRFNSRIAALVVSATLALVVLVLVVQQPRSQEVEYLVNVFVLIAALSAGWIGIFSADIAIRRQAYHELSLSRSYGLYKKFNLLALFTWVLTLVSGAALIPVTLLGFDFMGFALPFIGLEASLGIAALGFVATVLLGMLVTFAIRIPQIKKQEREVLALEARRDQLNDIFVSTD